MAGTSHFTGTSSPTCGVTADDPRPCSDGLGDIAARHPDLQDAVTDKGHQHPQLEISSRSAIDVSLDLIRSEPDKSITYIALGPLTDLSGMLKKDPTLVRERLGRVVCMGGALDVPGNSTPVAECQLSSLSIRSTDG
jgi:inosine-uridine nucleoside N-ribohydrolase